MILKIYKSKKLQDGGKIMQPYKDPYEYKQQGDEYSTRLKGSDKWIVTSGEIKAHIMNIFSDSTSKEPSKSIAPVARKSSYSPFTNSFFSTSLAEEAKAKEEKDNWEMASTISYKVKSGDTLQKVSNETGVSVADILRLNPQIETEGSKKYWLYANKDLKLHDVASIEHETVVDRQNMTPRELAESGIKYGRKLIIPESITTYMQYVVNGLARGYEFLEDDQSLFSTTEFNLTGTEINGLKAVVKSALTRGETSSMTYKDYTDNPDVDITGMDLFNTIDMATLTAKDKRHSLALLIGNGSFYLNADGDLIVTDDYDFNPSQAMEEQGVKVQALRNIIKDTESYKDKKGNVVTPSISARMHMIGERFKTGVPTEVNLGDPTDFLSDDLTSTISTRNTAPTNLETISVAKALANKGRAVKDDIVDWWDNY